MNKGMLVSFTETNLAIEEELKSWFVNEHIDERAIDTDGFFRARLYECLDEGPKFFATYETINFDILASEHYMKKVSNQTNWSKEIIPKLTMLERLTGKMTIDNLRGYGGKIITFRFLPLPERNSRDTLRKIFITELNKLKSFNFVNGSCLIENDSKISTSTGAKAQKIGGNPNLSIKDEWMIIIEGQDHSKLKELINIVYNEKIVSKYMEKKISINCYQLIYGNNR
ncbi:MAG: hypothetical protein CMM18_03465 [Rhodospirillaceae bacterium]|nr:hypothetical protein [Rhodospirillaceae bacterium]|tara:strand:+ start:691 stop:1371 length:681 start_codon:yes stop_codon:yes gene_type:complete